MAETAAALDLRYVVLTQVARDDLPNEGAGHFAATVRAVQERIDGAQVEVLTAIETSAGVCGVRCSCDS